MQQTQLQPQSRDDASKQLDFLVNETVWLRAIWHNWQALADPALEQRALLNELAGTFFCVTQDALFNDAVMTLCRTADSAVSKDKDNLTLKRTIATFRAVPQHDLAHPVDFQRLDNEFERFRGHASQLQASRHKVLAHTSLSVALTSKPAPTIQIQQVTKAVASLCKCIDILNESVCGGPVDWQEFDLERNFDGLLAAIRV